MKKRDKAILWLAIKIFCLESSIEDLHNKWTNPRDMLITDIDTVEFTVDYSGATHRESYPISSLLEE